MTSEATGFSSGARNAGEGAPVCPHCRRRMHLRVVEPVMSANKLDDMTYCCELCGTELKQTVTRS